MNAVSNITSPLIGRGLLAQTGGSFWMPPEGSSVAPVVDRLFYGILAVAAFFFALIVVLMVVFVIRYRRRPGVAAQKTATSHLGLELAWSLIPIAIVIVIFYYGFLGYMEMRTAPSNTYDIRVTARKWSWTFTYYDAQHRMVTSPELHVPADQPVKLTLESEDVIHSLYIPAFRVKMDVVPGRYNTMWFRAKLPEGLAKDDTQQYDLECAEYCGEGHSTMLTKVVVHRPGDFQTWLAKTADVQQNMAPGERLYKQYGCASCHSTDGTEKIGPSFKGIWGTTAEFEDGTSAVVDDNYVRESILDPSAKIVRGYPDKMSQYMGKIKDKEITDIIEFIKSLK